MHIRNPRVFDKQLKKLIREGVCEVGLHMKQRIASDIASCANNQLSILSAHKTTPVVKKRGKSYRGYQLKTRAERLSEKDIHLEQQPGKMEKLTAFQAVSLL